MLQSRSLLSPLRASAAALLLGALLLPAPAQTVFDFESADQLGDSSLVSGDIANFVQTNEQALTGSESLRFDYSTPDAYQSWTYDIPFALESGTLSVWFHDALGGNVDFDKFGGSIILEEIANPANFLAVEVWNAPYPASGDPSPGAPNYYVTRGNSGGPTTFNSRYFGDRSVGFHQVVFTVAAGQSTVTVDGVENANGAGLILGPGSSAGIRLRFMAWSASNGGFGSWVTDATPQAGFTIDTPYLAFDDLEVTAITPAADTRTEGFEIESGTATYDTPAEFMGPSLHDNPFMDNVVPQWNVTTDSGVVHGGAQALLFTNEDPVLKSIAFDLSAASPGQITFSFFDLFGPDASFDKVGGAIIVERISDPSNFIAAEIWNAPYPVSGDPTPGAPNYYATKGSAGNPATDFRSRYFGDRVAGWNSATITLSATESRIAINGIENSDGAGLMIGPGLNDGVRLRFMADSPSCGGFTNYALVDELNYLYLGKSEPYLYFDDVSLPVAPAAVSDWALYE
jgi:hypothetical protein